MIRMVMRHKHEVGAAQEIDGVSPGWKSRPPACGEAWSDNPRISNDPDPRYVDQHASMRQQPYINGADWLARFRQLKSANAALRNEDTVVNFKGEATLS